MQGQITHVLPARGFGFLRGDDGKEVFYHWSDVLPDLRHLRKGDIVTYSLVQPTPPRGPRACNITLIDRAADTEDDAGADIGMENQ